MKGRLDAVPGAWSKGARDSGRSKCSHRLTPPNAVRKIRRFDGAVGLGMFGTGAAAMRTMFMLEKTAGWSPVMTIFCGPATRSVSGNGKATVRDPFESTANGTGTLLCWWPLIE